MKKHTGNNMYRKTAAHLGLGLAFLTLCGCEIRSTDVVVVRNGHTTYWGQTANGKPHGIGVLTAGDSLLYSGQWQNGLRHGEGQVCDSLGRTISGRWERDSILTGMRRDSAGVYRGTFGPRLEASGHGAYRDNDGTYYEGQWKDDKRNGFGFSSQHRYFRVGEWKRNVYKGERLSFTSERIYGIDISKYQHGTEKKRYAIDWKRLRITHLGTLSKKNIQGDVDYKVSFVFIKSTEGTSVTNPYYRTDYQAARNNGYPVGSYHFFSHRSTGAQQARYFLEHTYVKKGDLPPVLDLEPYPSQVETMGGAAAMWKQVRVWLQTVEKQTGMQPILYISQSFVNRYLDAAPDIKRMYPVWIARYGEYKPDLKLWIWQLAPDGRVAGIRGTVDINVFNGYEDEFGQWLSKVRKQ